MKGAANHSVVRDQIASKEDMAFTEEKFGKQLATSKLKLEEILELPTRGYMEGTSLVYELIGGLIKRLKISKDGTLNHLIDADRDLEYIKQWNAHNSEVIQPFRIARHQIKKKMDEFAKEETQMEVEKQLYVQHRVSEEQNEAQITTTKGNRRGHDRTTNTGGRVVLKKTLLC